MSIWCSWTAIGFDRQSDGHRRGDVRTYADGFSNHYPDQTGSHELEAGLGIDHAAPWCVPGHDECSDCDDEVGHYLRLSMWDDGSLYWSAKESPARREPRYMAVVMDVEAARALRDDLDEWLAKAHIEPLEDA